MHLIAHRGFWKVEDEKNSEVAFKRALSNGFGIETDVRDFNQSLVISHDIPAQDSMSLTTFLEICKMENPEAWIALNVKSDGLQKHIEREVRAAGLERCFVFDMSVPDALGYLHRENSTLNVFTRHSEYEEPPSFCEEADGVWLDHFTTAWVNPLEIVKYLLAGKLTCVVSPELHSFPHKTAWLLWKSVLDESNFPDELYENFMICTDFPDRAQELFSPFKKSLIS